MHNAFHAREKKSKKNIITYEHFLNITSAPKDYKKYLH